MKKILLQVDDKVFQDLKSELQVKGICGTFHGNLDGFNLLLFKAIDEGKEGIEVIPKKKGKQKDESGTQK